MPSRSRRVGPLLTDVLIAGAGPTGLTLAVDLARRGVHVRIIDRAAAYFVGSRGKGCRSAASKSWPTSASPSS